MYIKRNYSQPFFSDKRRRRGSLRAVLFAGMLVGMVLLLVSTQREQLQQTVLEMVGMAPTDTPEPAYLASEGMRLFSLGNIEGAAALFQQAVAQRPDDLEYNYTYGTLLLEQLDYGSALLVADRLLDIAPFDPRGYALKTQALAAAGDSTQAVAVGQAGLEINREFPPLWSALSLAYISAGRYQEGFDAAVTAVDLDPMDYNARRAFAYALALAGRRPEAIEQLEIAISISPNLTAAYFEVAAQYLAIGDDERAIATYETILTLQPRNARAHLRLCEAYAKTGRFEQAVGFCQDAVSLDSSLISGYLQLGRLHYRARQFPEALSAFSACVQAAPENTECSTYQGLAYYYVGDCDQAWSVLQGVLPRVQGDADLTSIVRTGLTEISTYCPAYYGRAAGAALPQDLSVTPTPLPTPQPGA